MPNKCKMCDEVCEDELCAECETLDMLWRWIKKKFYGK